MRRVPRCTGHSRSPARRRKRRPRSGSSTSRQDPRARSCAFRRISTRATFRRSKDASRSTQSPEGTCSSTASGAMRRRCSSSIRLRRASSQRSRSRCARGSIRIQRLRPRTNPGDRSPPASRGTARAPASSWRTPSPSGSSVSISTRGRSPARSSQSLGARSPTSSGRCSAAPPRRRRCSHPIGSRRR